VWVFDYLGHGTSSLLQPFTLQRPAAFPVEDIAVSKGRNFEVSKISCPEVFYKRAVGDYDDIL
jgi:hypothetical protein